MSIEQSVKDITKEEHTLMNKDSVKKCIIFMEKMKSLGLLENNQEVVLTTNGNIDKLKSCNLVLYNKDYFRY